MSKNITNSNSDLTTKGCVEVVAVLILATLLIVLGGWSAFWLSYFTGWVAKCLCGETITNGLNMWFSNITNHTFVPNDIPMTTGILGFLGGFIATSKAIPRINSRTRD